MDPLKFEKEGLKIELDPSLKTLRKILERNGKPFFEGAAEGIKYLKKYEKH